MSIFNERLFCPVCNAHLGDRKKKEMVVAHCEECKATFIFRNDAKKPESKLDKDKKIDCGCSYHRKD